MRTRALAFSMEGYNGPAEDRRQLMPFAWAPGWNSPQAWNKFQDEVGGHLRAGDPGVRLFEAVAPADAGYAAPTPPTAASAYLAGRRRCTTSSAARNSRRAAPIQARIPQAYVAAAPKPMPQRLGVAEAHSLRVNVGGVTALRLPVRIARALAAALVGLPVGLPGIPPLDLPAALPASQRRRRV